MKKFINPELKVIEINAQDIISTSGGPILNGDGWLSEDDPLYNWDHPGWNNPNNPHFPY